MALAVCLVVGVGTSIFLAELAPDSVRGPIEALVQLLAGIPSVVFGLVGVSVVVPWITDNVVPVDAWEVVPESADRRRLAVGRGRGAQCHDLAVLRFGCDGVTAVGPARLHERRSGAGTIPLARDLEGAVAGRAPGLLAGLVLAAARAIGEAIALSMVAGSLATTPGMSNGPLYFLLAPVRTMASAIVETGGEAMSVDPIKDALFGLATLLLLFSILLSLAARLAFAWYARRTCAEPAR